VHVVGFARGLGKLWDAGRIEANLSYRERNVDNVFDFPQYLYGYTDQRSLRTWGFTPRYLLDKPIASFGNKFTFGEFNSFVAEGYQAMLERMLKGITLHDSPMLDEIRRECTEEIVDSAASELMLELVDLDTTSRDDFLTLFPRLIDLVNEFLETGRFVEISNVYNSLYFHALDSRFGAEAKGMVESFFSSKEESICRMRRVSRKRSCSRSE
jgi:hypothetical protein